MDILLGLYVVLFLALAVMPLTLKLPKAEIKKEEKYEFIVRAWRK